MKTVYSSGKMWFKFFDDMLYTDAVFVDCEPCPHPTVPVHLIVRGEDHYGRPINKPHVYIEEQWCRDARTRREIDSFK